MNPNIESGTGVDQTTPPEPAAPSAGGGPVRFYQSSDWLSFGVTAAISLAVYLSTLAPEVTLRFSGVFATGANYAGVPDVPGFPVWTLYAWLFTQLLPFSNIAWRVAVSSALAGAAACGLLALMVSRGGGLVLEGTGGLKRLRNPMHERWLRGVCAVAAGMGLALDRAVWSQAVIVETWTFALLLLAGTLSLLLRWSYEPQKLRYFYGAVALYALNLSNHQGMVEAALGLALLVLLIDRPLGRDLFASLTLLLVALFAIQETSLRPKNFWALFDISPIWQVCALCGGLTLVLSIVLALRTRELFTRWPAILGCWVALGLGLTPYFYLPITSMTNPPMNWGYARTVEGFVHLVSRGQYPGVYLVTDPSRYAQQLLWYAKITWENLGWMYLVAALVPFFFLRKMQPRERAWLLGLLTLYLYLSLFQVAMLNPAPDLAYWDWIRVFFSPAEFVQALFAGYGLLLIGTLLGAGRGLQAG